MAAEMWAWRRMLRVNCNNWKEKRTNISILKELGCKETTARRAIKRKLAYFGHIIRGSGSLLTLHIIEGKVEGSRKRGCQRNQWFNNIKELTGMSLIKAKRLAQDRDSLEKDDT